MEALPVETLGRRKLAALTHVKVIFSIQVFLDYQTYLVDCELEEWSEWTECTQTCDGGIRRREKKVVEGAQSQKGRDGCESEKDVDVCNKNQCGGKSKNVLLLI